MFASISGTRTSLSARTVRIAGPYVSITIAIPSTSASTSSRVIDSTSSRLRAGRVNWTSATPASCLATAEAYCPWRSVIPGSMSS